MITAIAFDADDTLWHNERIFISAKEKFKTLLGRYHTPDWIEQRLDDTESRNIAHFGYGIKGFTLSMIETAIELTEGRVAGSEITEILGFARSMMASPIDVLEGVRETVEALAGKYRLMVITKGDLFDQETKIARSGLGDFFDAVEIVSEKHPAVYSGILARHRIAPSAFLMVGNSLRSDILPVVEIGGLAVHVPYETEWFHDRVAENDLRGKNFATLERIAQLPDWITSRTG
ncbi:MAG: HAD family hydrolase [Acidobacteria bacterium]|nr:HAD family hydrolase [Acidobacteriota bacterium]